MLRVKRIGKSKQMRGKWIDDTNNNKEKLDIPQWRQLDRVSGSAALTEDYIDKIREKVSNNKIVFIDLRDECHGAVGNIPISYDPGENRFGSTSDFPNEENSLAALNGSLSRNPVDLYKENGEMIQKLPQGSKVESIKSICERKGFSYAKLPVKDHNTPDPQIINDFLEIQETYPEHHQHFNCRGGKGRTTMFLLMHAMQHDKEWVKNEPLESFIERHQNTGKAQQFLIDRESKDPLKVQRFLFLNDIYRYMHSRTFNGETQPFTEWYDDNRTSAEEVSSTVSLRRSPTLPAEEAPRIMEPETEGTCWTTIKRSISRCSR